MGLSKEVLQEAKYHSVVVLYYKNPFRVMWINERYPSELELLKLQDILERC